MGFDRKHLTQHGLLPLHLSATHQTQVRGGPVHVPNQSTRFDHACFGQHGQTQTDVRLGAGIAQLGDTALPRRVWVSDQWVHNHRREQPSGSARPVDITTTADAIAEVLEEMP